MKKWIALLLVLHFSLVLCGAAKVRPPFLGPLNHALALYLGFSGAHYSWGFFAPNIGSQFKSDFKIHLKDGREVDEQLGSHGPNEVLLRESGIAATFWFGMQDQKIRRSLTASWAAHEFSTHEDAESVDVNISAFYLPSMQQMKTGVRSSWVPVYSATYARNTASGEKVTQ